MVYVNLKTGRRSRVNRRQWIEGKQTFTKRELVQLLGLPIQNNQHSSRNNIDSTNFCENTKL